MYHIVVHLPCLLPEFSLNSDAPGVLFIMRGAVTEGCRAHSGLQPTIIVLQRYLFLRKFYVVYPSGPYVPHHTNLYSVVIRILALIIFAACHQTSFFFMRCSPNVVSSDDDDDDDPLIFLYFGAQALQTLWQCKKDKAIFQLQKKYFPIRFARRKASTKLQRWWLHQKKKG
jgi:hypothetical protein